MGRKNKGRPVHGWIAFDKPADMTSTQALNRVRHLYNAAKAGHGGTLDPIATGMLPIAFGEATKTMTYTVDQTKVYRITVAWGTETDTDDREGAVTARSDHRPTREAVEAVLPRFVGTITQIPPVYSALKIDGQRSYDLAREGKTVEPKPRQVSIHSIDLDDADTRTATLTVKCGKGTYMRALARDIARKLGACAHIRDIRRLTVGAFTLDVAVTLDQLEASAERGTLDDHLLPVQTPLDDIPAVAVTEQEAQRLRNGQPVPLLKRSDLQRLRTLENSDDGIVLALLGQTPVALATYGAAQIQPVRLLNLL